MNSVFDGGFETRLGEFLLVTFAAGHDVENEWYLVNTDSMIPDLVVVIERTDSGESTRLDGAESTFRRLGAGGFKNKLEEFILTAFARGERVEGTWTIRYGWAELPEWTVEIRRRNLGFGDEAVQLLADSSED